MPGVAAISGSTKNSRTGVRMVFMRRASDKPGYGRVYFRPSGCYERSAPVTENEAIARELFRQRAAAVRKLMQSENITKAEAWKRVKKEITNPQN